MGSSYEFFDAELGLWLCPRDELISSDEISPPEFKTTFDADSARISNLEVCVIPPRQEEPLRPHKVLTIEPSVYLQRLSELSCPALQLSHIVLSSILLHLLN